MLTFLSATSQGQSMSRIGADKLKIGKQGSVGNVSLEADGSSMKLIFNKTDNKIQFTNNGVSVNDLGAGSGSGLVKIDSESPIFTKITATTISVKAGTSMVVNGTPVSYAIDTAVTLPALVAGTDYAIYFCDDGVARADANFSAPTGYTTTNCKKTGGFHYGLVATTETVAGGLFATTGNGMIWTQADVDQIKGINAYSIWDLKFRPKSFDPRGMALIAGQFWVDIYFTNTNHGINGTSKYNTDVASGTVLPKKPIMFGGDGTATYADGNWWNFGEIARAYGKRFPTHVEVSVAAFGVTENQSLGGAASTIPATKREPGYTSKWGLEQATGHQWTWGAEVTSYAAASTWTSAAGRGSFYAPAFSAPLYGGYRGNAANSGSRASNWSSAPTNSDWHIGLRAACDHLKLP
jgi:hypothetical protein